MRAARPPVALWVAAVATVLALALPLVATADGTVELPGRALTIRVLLVVALGLAVFCAVGRRNEPRRVRQLLTVALVLVIFATALVIRFVTPTGAILLSIAIGGLYWERRALARA